MIRIGILIPNDYRLLSVAAILDVFEAANKVYEVAQKPLPFELNLFQVADAHQPVLELFHGYAVSKADDSSFIDLILVPAFSTDNMQFTIGKNRAYLPWLNVQFQKGARIATFCTGVFLLAASGLLNGKVATTHVDACPAFSAAFPEVILRGDKTVTQDGRLYTSGGSTSTFHLLLYLVQQYCNRDVAVKIAKIFAIDMDRQRQSYFSTFQPLRNHNDTLVAMVQQKIESNYQEADTIEELIKDIPSSRRNVLRRFKQITGIPPIEYLQQIRIEAAKKLLEQTNQHMGEVIFSSGYNDPKAFRRIFRKIVGMTPTAYREKFQAN
ncbi:GlxA family transcriptional regulator [Emticicia sp. 21SJ11W-3]|uniref:GlxA family transcriptional regulator n=1 Tax=Emticicia sp. 21SJ11W-3 TaxID=2916755 RepID=UPI00209C9188|nr:helix-turn-helix domain-containing protein [Emticicia sp. 21SJ11W-3]UTA69354.1 helix-turn-helix domain-containing protein [Emticicia sp. 21SJ11W-3]